VSLLTARRAEAIARMAGAEGPVDDFAERVRRNLADRRQGLEELCPEALDVAARALVALHRGVVGRQEALRGDRSGSYYRRQLRGEDTLPVEDLARLAIDAPTALVPALAVLAQRAGYALTPLTPMRINAAEAVASFAEQATHVVATHTRAQADGVIDESEEEKLVDELAATERRLSILRASLSRKR